MYYIVARSLAELCVKHGVLRTKDGKIMVYRNAGKDPVKDPEGWYLENPESFIHELMADEDGQRILKDCLLKRGVDFSITEIAWKANFAQMQKIIDTKEGKGDSDV